MTKLPQTTGGSDTATEEMIIRLFWMVDDRLDPVKKRPDARLYDGDKTSFVFNMRS